MATTPTDNTPATDAPETPKPEPLTDLQNGQALTAIKEMEYATTALRNAVAELENVAPFRRSVEIDQIDSTRRRLMEIGESLNSKRRALRE